MITIKVLKYLSSARESKRKSSKGDVKREATVRGALEKSRSLSIIEGRRSEKVVQSNTSFSRGSNVPLNSKRGNGN